MARGITALMVLLGLLLVFGCKDREEPVEPPGEMVDKSPVIKETARPEVEEGISADVEQHVDQAAEETEKAREKLELITSQARELSREAEVVGREVSRVTSQVADLNSRLDEVAGQAREVIDQAEQALNQILQARQQLQDSSGGLLQEIDQLSQPAPDIPSEEEIVPD
jgi:uncharacterized protein (DUF3084 family)